jgi:hypothetical protein
MAWREKTQEELEEMAMANYCAFYNDQRAVTIEEIHKLQRAVTIEDIQKSPAGVRGWAAWNCRV